MYRPRPPKVPTTPNAVFHHGVPLLLAPPPPQLPLPPDGLGLFDGWSLGVLWLLCGLGLPGGLGLPLLPSLCLGGKGLIIGILITPFI